MEDNKDKTKEDFEKMIEEIINKVFEDWQPDDEDKEDEEE